jgi:putative ABC transport system permease protein
MLHLAWRNLTREWVRFAVTAGGVALAVALMLSQAGILVGFATDTARMVNGAGADIWITCRDSTSYDMSLPFPERKFYKVLGVPGVARGEKVIMVWTMARVPGRGMKNVQVIGTNPESAAGGPWLMRSGSIPGLKGGPFAIVDESCALNLGGAMRVGDKVEVMDHALRIVGISQEAKALTTSSFIFTSFETARRVCGDIIDPDEITFALIWVRPGASVRAVADSIRRSVSNVDVYTTPQYSRKTQLYWLFGTGMGIGFLMVAVLGFVVGLVVVGQALYASTMDSLPEYGVLKALGSTNAQVSGVVLFHAIMVAFVGYCLGVCLAYGAKSGYETTGMYLALPPWLLGTVLVVAVMMCMSGALMSVRRIARVDPASVFRT